MKFRVYLTQTIAFDTEDETEQGAVKWAETHPELGKVEKASATAICKLRDMEEGEDGDDEEDLKEVEGHCEACDHVILEGEEYSTSGEDAIALCAKCTEDAKKEFQDRIAAGKCGYCGEEPPIAGEQFCADCNPDA